MNDRNSMPEELDDTELDVLTERAANEITEVDSDLLEEVAGGGGGTAIGLS